MFVQTMSSPTVHRAWEPPTLRPGSDAPPETQSTPADTYQPSEPSLWRSTLQGARRGTLWAGAIMLPLAVAGTIMESGFTLGGLASVALGTAILSAALGGPVGAAVGAVKHFLHRDAG